MKKFLALLLVLTMVFAMAACGGNNENTKPSDENTVPSTDNTENTENTDNTGDNDQVVVMTHEEFMAAENDSAVVVETYVQAVESWWDGKCHVYAVSEDGGYYIYGYACTEDEAAKLVPGTKILVSGYKTEWSGEVEIIDATIEILEGTYTATATDVTALLGTDELVNHMNNLVFIDGLTVAASTDANGNEVPFLYKWDGSGSQGDDIYFNVTDGTNIYTFTVNVYMIGTGADSDVYKAIESLQIGDELAVEGFLYWYNGAQPHITNVITAG